VLGLLVVLMAVSLLACEFYGFYLDHPGPTGRHNFALAKSFGIALAIGSGLIWFGRGTGRDILRKEAIAIVGLGWLLCTVVGAFPYLFNSPALDPAAAFFESASGFTTTGSTAIANLDIYPQSILLWRATTQWLGGMGILVLFVALLSSLGVGSKALFRHESTAQIGYGFHSRIRHTALSLWALYTALTAICVAGLTALGMSFYDALLHSFAAISTGGFSPQNASIMFYASPGIDVWLCIFMFLGGANFLLMAKVLRRDIAGLRKEEEFRTYFWIIALATAAVAADLVIRQNVPVLKSLQWSSFQVVSIMTTTGFVSADFDLWPKLSQAVLVVLMFVGGCSGSTAGGIKVGRTLTFFKTTAQQLVNSFRPSQIIPVRINGSILEESQKTSALFFIALAGATVAGGTLFILLLEPNISLVGSFTSVTAALFNIGPGLAEVGATKNFAFFSPPSHLILAFLMLLGRLEFFALLVLFLPSLWRRY
jgi:trk system potassium uptake protein TrkH